jgi:hypothetical protein
VHEHSLEVILPFLHVLEPRTRIVPVAVAEPDPRVLVEAGKNLAGAVREHGEPVSIVVSSDMSHYVSHETAQERDAMALERITSLDPEGLYDTVRRNNITMCGVMPMTMGLAACRELGAKEAEVAAYATSGHASGDYGRVVGYAGVLVR